MMNPYLTLDQVSCVLPTGRTLFSGLSETFDQRHTGLVGRNGAGKTVLAQILAGHLPPSSGRCLRAGRVHDLAQQIGHPQHATVADLAGVRTALDALARIEAGMGGDDDFEQVAERWDLRQRLQHALSRYGLERLDADTPASRLSGGEAMQVALVRARLSDADFLILDEPSNHLDRSHRHALIEQLRRWPTGLLVISHDRELLSTMDRIVELSPRGLRSYAGNYTVYEREKALERQSALQALEHRKREQQRQVHAIRRQQARQEKKQSRGTHQAKTANQAKVLLDRQKARSETSAGRLHRQHVAVLEQQAERVLEAAQQVDLEAGIHLLALPASRPPRHVAQLEQVELPFVRGATRRIDLHLQGQQRVGVVGPNGCGKSTLLKVLAGQIDPISGHRQRTAPSVYLDQRLSNLDPTRSVLESLQAVATRSSAHALRLRLALLDLDARKVDVPSGILSGGERLKGALACVLYADPSPALLLLDEPSNHLDLASMQALETLLRSYAGALVVVSHDEAFLSQLSLTDRLIGNETGWRREPW